MLSADLRFVIILMIVVSVVCLTLRRPPLRQRLPKIYLIARSWWCMLAGLCSCYVLAKLSALYQYPYRWLLSGFFLLMGLRALYEITRLWRPRSKARLLHKLQLLGVQPIDNKPEQPTVNGNVHANTHRQQQKRRLHTLDMVLSVAVVIVTISLISLQQLTWARAEYGVLLFVLFASQFNDIAQFLCGKWLKNKLFQRNLAPTISPNKSIEGALFGGLLAALLATLIGMWLTPFGAVSCFFIAYGLVISGIAGDLLESAFKRQHNVKDVGTMLAGHGGVLDRIDSLLIGVPLFTLGYWLY